MCIEFKLIASGFLPSLDDKCFPFSQLMHIACSTTGYWTPPQLIGNLSNSTVVMATGYQGLAIDYINIMLYVIFLLELIFPSTRSV